MTSPKRPRDPNQLAKLIVDVATGETEDAPQPAANEAQRKGGRAGGKARAAALTPAQRSAVAKKAAKARWEEPSDA